MHNILIVEGHPMMAKAIKDSVQGLLIEADIYTVNSLAECQKNTHIRSVDFFNLIIAELNLPDSEGMPTLHALRSRYPFTEILVFSQMTNAQIESQILRTGSASFIAKTEQPQVLVQKMCAILERVQQTKPSTYQSESFADHTLFRNLEQSVMTSLTTKQRSVLQLLAKGQSSAEIAMQIKIAEPTVRSHLTDIYRRLNVKKRAQAIVLYYRWMHWNELQQGFKTRKLGKAPS